jgi:type III secretion protein K
LTTLARRIGLVLCAPRLRYAISGEAVRALQAALGTDAWRWVKDGGTMHRGLPGPMFKNADDAVRNVDRAGYAALYTAFQSATQEVARRFVLKLPCSLPPPVGQDGAPDDRSCQTAATTIEREVAAAIDSETAMSLAMALYAALDSGGENGIFA